MADHFTNGGRLKVHWQTRGHSTVALKAHDMPHLMTISASFVCWHSPTRRVRRGGPELFSKYRVGFAQRLKIKQNERRYQREMKRSDSFVVNPLRRGKWGNKRVVPEGGGGGTVCRHMCKLWKQPLELAQPLATMATKFQGESLHKTHCASCACSPLRHK